MDEVLAIDIDYWNGPDQPGRQVSVQRSASGHYWVGMTYINNPKDYEFHGRDQYGTDDTGRAIAIDVARKWAIAIIRDRRWTK